MKLLMLMALSLTMVTTAHADELSSNALQTLLSSKTSLSGDVHSYETVESIYSDAVNNGAKILNECEVVKSSSPFAKCTLWINYTLGETALQYEVNLPGTTLRSSYIEVSRGD